MALFKELTAADLLEKILALSKQITCSELNKHFYFIRTNRLKKPKLREKYQSPNHDEGIYTQAYHDVIGHTETVARAREKLESNHFKGLDYVNDSASLKCHLNLNQIGNVDEVIILDFINFLINEAHATPSLYFDFKIIVPTLYSHSRFQDTDQITLYFDKYSSTAELIQLTKKIEQYLKEKNIPENNITLGPKDQFGFNSFVSARFDNNKLLKKYDQYSFFDLELKQFFSDYKNTNLSHIPLCAFEAVFTNILASKSIHLQFSSQQTLTSFNREKVKQEFVLMMRDPKNYIRTMGTPNKREEKETSHSRKRQRELITYKHVCKFYWILSSINKQMNKSFEGEKAYRQLVKSFSEYCEREQSADSFLRLKTECLNALNDAKAFLGEPEEQQRIYKSLSAVITYIGVPFKYKTPRPGVLFFNRQEAPVSELLNNIEQINPSQFVICTENKGAEISKQHP